MKFATRITIAISTVSIGVLLVAGAVLSIRTTETIRNQETAFASKTMELASHHFETSLRERVQEVRNIADCDALLDLLATSNGAYGGLSPADRQEAIGAANERWVEATVDDKIVLDCMVNPVARHLKREQAQAMGSIGEIFLTNRFGAVVATTQKLTTFAHAHKYWWRAAYAGGDGRVFLDDRGYDDSVRDHVLGFVVPVIHDGTVVGILKANFRIDVLLNRMLQFGELLGKDWDLAVARSNGVLLAGTLPNQRVPVEVERSFSRTGGARVAAGRTGAKQLFVCSPIRASIDSEDFAFGGTAGSIDHSLGNTGQYWVLIASVPVGTLTQTVRQRMLPSLVPAFVLLIAIVPLAVMVSRGLTRRVRELEEAVVGVDKHTLDWPKVTTSTDEVGVLETAFARLVSRVRDMLVEKDQLLEEQRRLNSSLFEKDVLIREVHHRVKNNLTMVQSLISLNESMHGLDLVDIRTQIQSITMVHDLLHRSHAIESVDLREYLEAILFSVLGTREDVEYDLRLVPEQQRLAADTAVPVGLVVNEIATNAVKHGFDGERANRFGLTATRDIDSGTLFLHIWNSGRPFPEGVGLDSSGTLGMSLISALVAQLGGTVDLQRRPRTTFIIRVPLAM